MPRVRAALLVALGYYVGAKIGIALTLESTSVSTLWPPDAILLAGLVLTPVRSWVAVCAATFVAHLAVQLEGGIPLAMILGRYVSTSAGALVGAAAFRRLHTGEPRLDRHRETVLLLVCAGFLAPFVSSFLDTALVALNGWGQTTYWTNWQTRFFSSVLSAITIVPLIVTTARSLPRVRQVPRRKLIEAVVIFSLLLVASWFAFVRARPVPASFPVLVCVPVPGAGGSGSQAGIVGRRHIVHGLCAHRNLGDGPRPGALRGRLAWRKRAGD